MRYFVAVIVGLGLWVATLTALVIALTVVLKVFLMQGGCAEGGPYQIRNPCPAGTTKAIVVLSISIFPLMIGAGIWKLRGSSRSSGPGMTSARLLSNTVVGAMLFFGLAGASIFSVIEHWTSSSLVWAKIGIIVFAVICIAIGIAIVAMGSIWRTRPGISRPRPTIAMEGSSIGADQLSELEAQAQMGPNYESAGVIEYGGSLLHILVSLSTVVASAYGAYYLMA